MDNLVHFATEKTIVRMENVGFSIISCLFLITGTKRFSAHILDIRCPFAVAFINCTIDDLVVQVSLMAKKTSLIILRLCQVDCIQWINSNDSKQIQSDDRWNWYEDE